MDNPLLLLIISIVAAIATGGLLPGKLACLLVLVAALLAAFLWFKPASYPDGGLRGFIALMLALYATIASLIVIVRF